MGRAMKEPSTALTREEAAFQAERFSVQHTEGLYVLSRTESRSWLNAIKSKILKLRDLKAGWDSYGANPVDIDSIETAIQLVCELAAVTGICEPAVSATPSGHAALTWSWKSGTRELEIEMLPTGKLQYCFSDDVDPQSDQQGFTQYPAQIAVLLTTA